MKGIETQYQSLAYRKQLWTAQLVSWSIPNSNSIT